MNRIEIRESEIADYLFHALIELGYAPKGEELDDLAAIFFDFLIDIGAIDEDEIAEEEE